MIAIRLSAAHVKAIEAAMRDNILDGASVEDSAIEILENFLRGRMHYKNCDQWECRPNSLAMANRRARAQWEAKC